MKKHVRLIAVLLVFISTLSLFACNKIDTGYMHIKLNGGSYTEAYKTEKGYSDDSNVSAIINKDYFEGACNYLPDATDMIAPEGKVFAGWYFTEDASAGTYFTEENYLAKYAESESDSASVYARWIDVGNINVIVDLNNKNADFTADFCQLHGDFKPYEFVLSTQNLEGVIASLPTSDQVVHQDENYGFRGWYLDKYYQKPVTLENLQIALDELNSANTALLNVYGWWDYGYSG